MARARLDIVGKALKALGTVTRQHAQLLRKGAHVAQVSHAQPVARGLARVGRPDAALRRPDLLPRQLRLAQAINLLPHSKAAG